MSGLISKKVEQSCAKQIASNTEIDPVEAFLKFIFVDNPSDKSPGCYSTLVRWIFMVP